MNFPIGMLAAPGIGSTLQLAGAAGRVTQESFASVLKAAARRLDDVSLQTAELLSNRDERSPEEAEDLVSSILDGVQGLFAGIGV